MPHPAGTPARTSTPARVTTSRLSSVSWANISFDSGDFRRLHSRGSSCLSVKWSSNKNRNMFDFTVGSYTSSVCLVAAVCLVASVCLVAAVCLVASGFGRIRAIRLSVQADKGDSTNTHYITHYTTHTLQHKHTLHNTLQHKRTLHNTIQHTACKLNPSPMGTYSYLII